MSDHKIMVTQSDLFDALKGMMNFTQDDVEHFISMFDYIEDNTGDWFALSKSLSLVQHCEVISPEKTQMGWFAFWMCVFNNSESGSPLESDSLGAIRGLYFLCRHVSDLVAESIETWWEETIPLHRCNSLQEQ